MSSGSDSSKQSSVPVRLLPGCFRQTKHWCWCQNLGSHILAFLNSVRLPSWIYELIFMQVNKLKVMNLLLRCDITILLHREGDCHHLMPSDRSVSPVTWVFLDRGLGYSLVKISADNRLYFAPHPRRRRTFWLPQSYISFLVLRWTTSLQIVAVAFLNYWYFLLVQDCALLV